MSGKPVVISNNGAWLAKLGVEGQGVMMAPRWSVARYLEDGELTELPMNPRPRVTQNSDLAIYLLYQKPRYRVPKIKALVDFLVERLGES